MCGYYGFLVGEWQSRTAEMLAVNDIPVERHYTRRVNNGLVRERTGKREVVSAFWWYQLSLKRDPEQFTPEYSLTTFNARDLASPFWRAALASRRCILPASEIGESEGKKRFLMQADEPIYLAGLYKDWQNPDGSTTTSYAVITRPPHDRFSQYHSKSIPLMLPQDREILDAWLKPEALPQDMARDLLEDAAIRANLSVTEVKTYARGEPLGPQEQLLRDHCKV